MIISTGVASPAAPAASPDPLRAAANALEAQFLAQMLRDSGLGKSQGPAEGGIGEEQFSSFLVEQHAQALVKAGGIGLSESIYRSLLGRQP